MTPAVLAAEIAHLKERLAEAVGRIEKNEERIRGLRDFQLWITGGLSAAAFFGGLFAAKIKAVFGI
jgi:hypothetical protein